ncbi:MAG TPA: lactate dehydrogenase [Candidatus Enterocloster faecavium]|uniref:Lactate dehydrogenase n=1 Tax=Candidatus Enterocloster faecavium TaxID=2838560 RepID=A0A9D2RIN5_9FIRM|nr:lactate dehydrogenase [Candidatus Enterocloster faecavium]
MKMMAFSCRQDEMEFFRQFGEQYGVEVETTKEAPCMENAELLKGCQAACVLTTPVDAQLIDQWHQYGVQLISTRTVGFEHVDYRHAAKLGIAVTNATYTPDTVAEYTIMTILMAIRKMKIILNRYIGQDFSLRNVRGRELGPMTVGVVGTGRIGQRVIELLGGFGCEILAYDLEHKEEVRRLARYVSLETIWEECDLITFHTPATEETCHMVNRHTIGQMKDGVVLINMARGSIIDTEALIEGLETGKVGAAALDVVENEGSIYYKDFKDRPVCCREMSILSAMPNVLMTPHTAFFTQEAVSDMVECAMLSCARLKAGEKDPLRVNG